MNFFEKKEELQSKLKYRFKQQELLAIAFIHRSFWNENQHVVSEHNERLEFLGDSILGLIVSHYLYLNYPNLSEGVLSEHRSRLVNAPACAGYAQELKLGDYLLLGKGELLHGGKEKESILADLFEAIVGAIYLDGGFEEAEKFFLYHFNHVIQKTVSQPARNWKAELQDFTQKQYQQTPIYELIEEHGPPHKKTFQIGVWIQGEKKGEGSGSSKKEAQTYAAQDALKKLNQTFLG